MRAVIFADVAGRTTRSLIAATVSEARRHGDLEIQAVVTANPDEVLQTPRQRAGRFARAAVVAATGGPRRLHPAPDLAGMACRWDLELMVAEKGVNDPAFIDRLHDQHDPQLLLSYFCTQILRAPLLDSMDQAVNYHDGLLPSYGGLAATGQSIYHGETESGFTFHRITTGIDDGPLLVQGSVPIGPDSTADHVDQAKISLAVKAVPQVLDKIAVNDPGTPQVGPASYFSRKDALALIAAQDPSSMTGGELARRLRAFGSIELVIDGTPETVSEVRAATTGQRFSFITSDGQRLRATRMADMAAWATAVRRATRRPGRPG